VKKLGEVYGLDTTGNVELRFRFFQLALGEPKSEAANHFAKVAVNWVAGTDGSGVIKGGISSVMLTLHNYSDALL
jgi:leukotriene-A4 hydrolase